MVLATMAEYNNTIDGVHMKRILHETHGTNERAPFVVILHSHSTRCASEGSKEKETPLPLNDSFDFFFEKA
jgi:hypothetical protein